ncbi:MAG: tRNA lysidine(34) synthetase TilS [Firmicutes bacterium]|nr:tRNA lysidine(34) synthetase TilS [Bacillota bacterium]
MIDKDDVLVYNILMMKKQILTTMETHNLIEDGAHIVIGLSGGPDSVCLFDILCQLSDEHKWTLYPVHINHQLRPGDAEKDQAYVEELCQKRNWPCQSFVYDCNTIAKEKRMTSEEAGRHVRYEAFAKVASKIKESGVAPEQIVIAVAQNADDQAETILFRLMRGAGTDGLAGIPYQRWDEDGNRIVRPLLDCWKKDILAYCRNQNLQPRMDHTNDEAIYTRNKIRLQLLPLMEGEYNPNIKDTMVRMGKTCANDRDFLWQCAKSSFDDLCKAAEKDFVLLDGPGLKDLHSSIRQRVLAIGLQQIGLQEDVGFVHYEQCQEIIFREGPSDRVDLPKGYYLAKNYEDIKISKPQQLCQEKEAFLRVTIMDKCDYDKMELSKESHGVFDADQMAEAYAEVYGEHLTDAIGLRTRQPGDVISIGEGKRKKIQNLLVDQKIPKDIRDQVKLVTIGHDVLWMKPPVGKGRFSADFKVSKDTKKVICIEIICGS